MSAAFTSDLLKRLRQTIGSGVLSDGTLVPVYSVNPDGYEAASLIEELCEALRKLEAEVGALGAFEDAVREAICNTNYSCLMERAEQARAALAKARGETPNA